jgi:hypothetical protein
LDLGRFFSFLILYTVGRAPWTGDQLVARPLPTHRTTQTQNKRMQTSMPRLGLEPTTPVFERAKTVHALDRTATVSGQYWIIKLKYYFYLQGYNGMKPCENQQMFRRRIWPPSSGSKRRPINKQAASRALLHSAFSWYSSVPTAKFLDRSSHQFTDTSFRIGPFSQLFGAVHPEPPRGLFSTLRTVNDRGGGMNLNEPEHAVGCQGIPSHNGGCLKYELKL